ncbi:MAG: hypothetical protein EP314_02620, partial [Bacteroidetes bacterium]
GRFNIVYADRNDTIYYVDYGMIPDRNEGYNYEELLPGNTSRTNWDKVIPLERLPYYLNPECGYVFNTNNAPFNATCEYGNLECEAYHPHMGFRTNDNNRSVQFQNLIEAAGDRLSWDEFKAIKWDQALPTNHVFLQSMQNAFALEPEKYPDIADAIAVVKRWNFDMGPQNMQAAFAYAVTQKVMKAVGRRSEAVEEGLYAPDSLWVNAVRKTKEEFLRHFDKLEMPFGEVQTFTRSGKTVGLGGIADVLAAAASEWDAENGTMECKGGDTYVQLTRFTKEGLPHIESLMAGGNSDRPDSPHFNDQMDLLAGHRTKPMTLDKEQVLKEAVKVYHPE